MSEHELKNPKNQPGATSGWRVYLRPVPNGPALTPWLKKVTFLLHETFTNSVRTVESVNPATGGFEIEETAYAGFLINIKMYFVPASGEKWQQRTHFLQFDPYSGNPDETEAEKEREAMRRANLVRSETVEVVEFNEPNEAFWDALTSPDQWDYLRQAHAKSKGAKSSGSKSARSALAQNTARITEYPPPPGGEYVAGSLPEKPLEQGHIWSRETEDLLIDALKKAEEECEGALIKTLTRSKELNTFIESVKEGREIDEKLRTLWESLPQKKK